MTAPDKIDRFEPCSDEGYGRMMPDPLGDWVLYADAKAVIARLREALDSIEELNKFPPDEHGRRWWRSDLIGQEIILARMHTAVKPNKIDTLAEALPREIARISAKRDRWRDMVKDYPSLHPGMQLSIAIMQVEIDLAVMACASGDVVEMLAAHQALKDYTNDD